MDYEDSFDYYDSHDWDEDYYNGYDDSYDDYEPLPELTLSRFLNLRCAKSGHRPI